jgi:peptide chain release factor 3
VARATDEDGATALEAMRDVEVYRRESGAPMALFRSRYVAERIARDHPELTLDTLVLS